MSLTQPLARYRAMEIGSGAGALCGRVLAGLGVDVVKVEPLDGDPMRRQGPFAGDTGISFLWFNANKGGVTVDFDEASVQQRVRASLGSFDLLIDGNVPGWLADHGLDPAELIRDFPHLIIVSVTHFGQTGPYRDWAGSGLVDFALAGSLLRSGLPDRAPTAPPYHLPLAMGGVTAASAAVSALWNRGRTGKGDWIDCSITEAVQAQADWSVPGYAATGTMAKRAGAGPLFRLWKVADGWVRVINLSAKQWNATLAWLGNPPEISGPEWANPLYRAANPGPIDIAFDRHFAGRTRHELFLDGQAHGVGIVPVYNPAEVMEDAHFRERGTFVPFEIPGGVSAFAPGSFVRMAGEQLPPPRPAPNPGGSLAVLDGPPVALGKTGDQGLPLSGIRVVELGSGAVAPEIARILGLLGADVIKIESMKQIDFMRLQGVNIEASSGWSSSNRNKRSIRLDMKHADGRGLGYALAKTADVIIENNTGGAMNRLGIGYDQLSRENPRVVYLSSQAFGATGPAAGFGGFGPTNQAVSSTTYLWNHPEIERPEGVAAIHPDHLLGRMGAMAALAALDEVRNGGGGQHIDLGQAEFAMACVGEAFIESSLLGRTVEARGNESPLGAPHGVFPCLGDDQWIAITVETDAQWVALVTVVGEETWKDASLATAPGRIAQRDLVEAQLGAWTSQGTNIQLMRRLQAAGVPAGAAYSIVQVMADVHLNERGYFQAVTHPALGAMRMEGVPYQAQNMRHQEAVAAPLFGQHTNDILREWLALPENELTRLAETGVFT